MSESYRALTRKYRPKSFDDVVSQQHIISTLRNAIEQNRISHAYLFCGPRGVGKTTMARVVARLINGVSMDIDGEELSRTLDIIEIDAASNSGVDDVRLLRDGVRVPPQQGRFKVYIIDEVHMLSKAAFNALLKTLEEPPEHVKFIFATTEPHKVLPTVMSRVQRFDFRRITVGEIVDRLQFICDQEKITIDDASLHLIGRKADGALRDALSIMDQVIAFCGNNIQYEAVLNALNVINTDRLYELTECVQHHDAARGMQIVHDLLLQRHDIQEFLVSITEHLRNLYFSRFAKGGSTLLEVPEEERERLKHSATFFSEHDLLRMMHLTSEAQIKIRDSQQPRVLLEISILKLIMMDRSEGLQSLLAEIQELKKKTELNGKSEEKISGPDPHRPSAQTSSSAKSTEYHSQTTTSTGRQAEALNSDPTILPVNGQEGAKNTKNNSTLSASDIPKEDPHLVAPTPTTISKSMFGAPAIKKKPQITSNVVQSAKNDQLGAEKSHQIEKTSAQNTTDLQTEEVQSTNATAHAANPASSKTAKQSTIPVVADLSTNAEKHSVTVLDKEAVEKCYPQWIEGIRQGGQQVLALSLGKTRLLSTGPDWILIECQDEFIMQLINEHHEKLSSVLGELLKRNVTIKAKVIQLINTTVKNDPYAALMTLQEEQPIVKSIVEVLGAELEY
jgi:DNA polymerase III subunit gamma/tau